MRDSFDPFNAAIVAVFAGAAWMDGAIWLSGLCGGIAIMMFIDFIDAWATSRAITRRKP